MDIMRTVRNPVLLKRRASGFVVKSFRLLFIIGLCYLFLFPLFYLIVAAVQDPAAAKDPTVVWIPTILTKLNFTTAMEFLNYKNSLTETLKISIVSTAATLISCSMVGYGFARFKFREKNIAFALVMLTIIVPPQTVVMSNYVNFRYFNLFGLTKLFGFEGLNFLNSPLPFSIPALFANGLRAGLFILIFRQIFAGQPKELEEAARIDGCGAFATFRRIMVPLAVPAFITVMLFCFVWHWNENFSSNIFYTEPLKRPLAVQLNAIRMTFLLNQSNSHYSPTMARGTLAAGSLLSLSPLLVLYIFTQKHFTESIERSGIVG